MGKFTNIISYCEGNAMSGLASKIGNESRMSTKNLLAVQKRLEWQTGKWWFILAIVLSFTALPYLGGLHHRVPEGSCSNVRSVYWAILEGVPFGLIISAIALAICVCVLWCSPPLGNKLTRLFNPGFPR